MTTTDTKARDAVIEDDEDVKGHTPTPWFAGHLAHDDHPCNCPYILAEDGLMGAVAYVCVNNGLDISDGGNDAPPIEQAKANLRLIVKAVNYYVALKSTQGEK